jgi:hypothetical protein
MTEKPFELGLYIDRHYDICNEIRVAVRVVRRSDDGKSIQNLGRSFWDERLAKRHQGRDYDDLVMLGHVYEGSGGRELIGFEPEYRNVFSVDLRDAKRFLKTLSALQRDVDKWRKANGGEMSHVNMMGVFARFVSAQFVVLFDNTKRGVGSYSQHEWQFFSVEQGLRVYESQIDRLKRDWINPWKERAAS